MKRDTLIFTACGFLLGLTLGSFVIGPKIAQSKLAGAPAAERTTSGWGLPALRSLLPKLPQGLPYQKQAYQTSQNELTYSAALPDSPYVSVADWETLLRRMIH